MHCWLSDMEISQDYEVLEFIVPLG
jgi:hypothetical protein